MKFCAITPMEIIKKEDNQKKYFLKKNVYF